MGKNLVVCCDGTANQVVQGSDTNVVRLCGIAIKDDRQIVYYSPGLGTLEAEGALTWFGRLWTKVAGLAAGYGIARDISNAYAFIMAHYEPDDRLYLFGFSRGAYTARAVASLLRLYGLLRVGNEALVPYLIRELLHFDSLAYRLVDALTHSRWQLNKKRVDAKFAKAREICSVFATRPCRPHFVGVWDTVSSVGWAFSPTRIPYTAKNEHIRIGRHALALDERRAFFIRNLWQRDPLQKSPGPLDIKEVWFAGVHSDIGGGYPDAKNGLSKITLDWMVREARAADFLADPTALERELGNDGSRKSRPDPSADLHNSMIGLWPLAEFVPLVSGLSGWRLNLFRRRHVPIGALIHSSVAKRAGYTRPLPEGYRTEI
ncbi:MAG TPA: DUF2235 domain-containing protein [Reyranella sp.]|jgi:uncharacterized protein (DUF2235 family)